MTRIKKFAIIYHSSLTRQENKRTKTTNKGGKIMGSKETRRPLWEVFSELTSWIRADHIKRKAIGGGHDFLHALMVAQYAEIIAEDEHTGMLAWIAGIIHNTDRLFPKEQVKEKLHLYLNKATDFSSEEKGFIIEAVLNHSKLNDPKDKPVTVVLKDADKLANIGPNLIVRSGQFYHTLPAYDPRFVEQRDPTATFREPKTVLHDISLSLEWKEKDKYGSDWFRVPKAKKLSERWFERLQIFWNGFAEQLKEVNLLPYPFEEDYASLDQK